ncbi:MAG TPA: hypothetical protein PKC50_09890, partial [Elusimicrobiota bacterium]|nr:hypothetical protein [Elusimicrobiota bacterium]
GRPAYEAGPYLALLVLGVWAGSLIASRLVGRVPMARLLVGANALSVAAAAVFLAAVLLGQLSIVLTVGSMFLFTVGVGTAAPAAKEPGAISSSRGRRNRLLAAFPSSNRRAFFSPFLTTRHFLAGDLIMTAGPVQDRRAPRRPGRRRTPGKTTARRFRRSIQYAPVLTAGR